MKLLRWLLLSGLLFLSLPTLWGQGETSPTLVWSRPEGGMRNEYLFFRREFTLASLPAVGELHLYA
ncbi:MAG: hypothetical protein AAGA31_07245, partial [Bacteroidota bacterium]